MFKLFKKKLKRYRYFVSYTDTDGNWSGRVEVTRDTPITCIQDVEGMERSIEKDCRPSMYQGMIVITHYKLMAEVVDEQE